MRWCRVGGLTVAPFAIEAGQISPPTTDSRPDIDEAGARDTIEQAGGADVVA